MTPQAASSRDPSASASSAASPPSAPEDGALILGVDPGTAATGYGLVRSRGRRGSLGTAVLVECGVVRTRADEPLPLRLRRIYEGLDALLERFEPTTAAVENVFQGKNVRSALTLGHARGAAILAAALRSVPVAEYTPREVKKAVVGTGGATKDQVGYMVQRHLRLKRPPEPADAADAVAAALCHCFTGAL